MDTPSVSSDIGERQYDIRHIGIFSDDGEVSMKLSSYTDMYGKKRIVLNDLDISLKDFNNYLNSILKDNLEHINTDYIDMYFMVANILIGILLFMLGALFVKIDCMA